jgi:hypothetical protein|tara:strand:- start:8409 stop:8795 length:387 start_codon:yes stop_codon:yes gene_type:complete
MATLTKTNPVVANAIGEIRNIGKEITMVAVDWDVDADASRIAMEAVHNTIMQRATILAAGAVYDTGTKQDFILEGDFPGSDYVSEDGTVTGTFAQALVEDIINLGTVDSINFASGTVAATVKTTLKFA